MYFECVVNHFYYWKEERVFGEISETLLFLFVGWKGVSVWLTAAGKLSSGSEHQQGN